MEGLENIVLVFLTSLIKLIFFIRMLFASPIHFLRIDLGSRLLSE